MADLDLIANQDTSATGFQHILERLRSKESSAPTLEEITKDIELARSKHYAKKSEITLNQIIMNFKKTGYNLGVIAAIAVLLWIGIFKFTATEAMGIKHYVSNSFFNELDVPCNFGSNGF